MGFKKRTSSRNLSLTVGRNTRSRKRSSSNDARVTRNDTLNQVYKRAQQAIKRSRTTRFTKNGKHFEEAKAKPDLWNEIDSFVEVKEEEVNEIELNVQEDPSEALETDPFLEKTRCLICYHHDPDPLPLKGLLRKPRKLSIPDKLEDDLWIIHLLKMIFQWTTTELGYLMKHCNGQSPREWIQLCQSCRLLIFEIQTLEDRMRDCRKKIKDKIMKTEDMSSFVPVNGGILMTRRIRCLVNQQERSARENTTFIDGDKKADELLKLKMSARISESNKQSLLVVMPMRRGLSDGSQVRLERLGDDAGYPVLPIIPEAFEQSPEEPIRVCDAEDSNIDDDNDNYLEAGEAIPSTSEAKCRRKSLSAVAVHSSTLLPHQLERLSWKALNLRRKCDICQEFIPHRNLEDHLKTHPQFEKLYKCDICPDSDGRKVYGSYKGLVWHYLQSPHFNVQLPCKLCPRSNQTTLFLGRELCKHLYDFHKLDHKKVKCNFENCSEEFCDPVSRSRHRVHKHRAKSLECEICHKTYPTKEGLEMHMKLHRKKQDDKDDANVVNCWEGEGDTTSEFSTRPRLELESLKTGYGNSMCDICYERIPRYKREQHLRTHAQFEKYYICDICPDNCDRRIYGSYKGLIWHYLQARHNVKMSCNLCPAPTQTILFRGKELCKHLYHFHQIHHGKLQCTFGDCSQEFCDPLTRHSHRVYQHFPKHRGRALKCDICQKTFKAFQGLKQHMKLHESEHERLFPCKSCGKVLTCVRSLQQHEKTHEEGYTPVMVECPQCSKKLRKKALQHHIRNKHGTDLSVDEEGRGQFPCDLCKKYFKSKSRLDTHIEQIHTEGKGKLFICDSCPKEFKTRGGLWMHKEIHHEEKVMVVCPHCPRQYARFALEKHVKSAHGEKKFQCRFCPKSFTGRQRLQYHEEIHKNERRYKCGECPYSANTPDALQQHHVINHVERTVECKQCLKTFPNKQQLKKHEGRGHREGRSFKCEECPKTFVHPESLNRHKRTKHGNNLPISNNLSIDNNERNGEK